SQQFNIPLSLILASNPQIPSDQLIIGQQIKIPGFRAQTYTIQAGDSLWSIAQAHQLPLDLLFITNPTANTQSFQIGQVIIIPERVTSMIISDVNHYTYNDMLEDLAELMSLYHFIRHTSIDLSVLEKDIVALQVGVGTRQKHINGSFHANEWITTPVIMQFLNEYALSLINNQPIRGLHTLPFFED